MRHVVPVFDLYGEQQAWPTPDLVHCESIEVRSRLHDWHIRPHQHSGLFQMLLVQHGGAQIQLDGRRDALQAGQILVVPQGCVHGFEFERDTRGLVLTLAQPLLNRLLRPLGSASESFAHPCWTPLVGRGQRAQADAMFERFDREYRGDGAHRTVAMEALLSIILVWMVRHLPLAGAAQPVAARNATRHFGRFNELLEAHFCQHRPVSFYAAEIGVTAAHLNIVCRDIGARSALQIIHARLLLEARRSLVYTSMQVGEISNALGFSEPAYFTRFFKRATAASPTAFRAVALLGGRGNNLFPGNQS